VLVSRRTPGFSRRRARSNSQETAHPHPSNRGLQPRFRRRRARADLVSGMQGHYRRREPRFDGTPAPVFFPNAGPGAPSPVIQTFEEGGLRPRRCAVDLVHQDQMRKDWTRAKLKLTVALIDLLVPVMSVGNKSDVHWMRWDVASSEQARLRRPWSYRRLVHRRGARPRAKNAINTSRMASCSPTMTRCTFPTTRHARSRAPSKSASAKAPPASSEGCVGRLS